MDDIREKFDSICNQLATETTRLKWKEEDVERARERILNLKIEKAIIGREITLGMVKDE
jgi:hypothetical protein